MKNNVDFAANLRQARMERGMTQKCLAEKSGVSRNSIGYYENKKIVPSLQTLFLLADALDVSASYLLREFLE